MARGGARNRSGPQADPNSARSQALGVKLTALPASGWDGPVPEWPLMPRPVLVWEMDVETHSKRQVVDEELTQEVAARELELWRWAWRTPQACAWARPSEAWRLNTIAMWVRTFVICEGHEAKAADKGALHRFADQIGFTPAGLKENGWQVAPDEVAERRAERELERRDDEEEPPAPRRRLRAV